MTSAKNLTLTMGEIPNNYGTAQLIVASTANLLKMNRNLYWPFSQECYNKQQTNTRFL